MRRPFDERAPLGGRDGRDRVGCIVLGRGEDEAKVIEWLQTAAAVDGFIGFAVGRSTFLDSIVSLRAGKTTAAAASAEIARRYRKWVDIFEQASKQRGARPAQSRCRCAASV